MPYSGRQLSNYILGLHNDITRQIKASVVVFFKLSPECCRGKRSLFFKEVRKMCKIIKA